VYLEKADRFLSVLFNTGPLQANIYSRTAGLSGLLMFSFGLSMSKSLQLFGLIFMLIGLIIDHKRAWRALKSSPAVILIFLFLVYIWVRTCYGIFIESEIDTAQLIDGARKYSYFLILPVFAWWLMANEKVISRFFLITIITTILYIILFSNVNPLEFAQGRPGDRNLPTLLLAYALFLGILVVWLTSFAAKLALDNKHGKIAKLCIFGLLAIAWATVLLTLIHLAARATITALLVALAIVFPLIIYKHLTRRTSMNPARTKYAAIIIAFIIVGPLVYMSVDTLKDRYMRETEVFEHLQQGRDPGEIPTTSLGQRLHMWMVGADKFQEKPLIGHGWGVPVKIPDRGMQSHFHNTFVETVVAWGILGAMLFFGVFVVMGTGVVKAWRKGTITFEMLVFLGGATIVILASAMTHSLGIRQTTWTYAALWAGVVLSYCLDFRKQAAVDENS